MPRSALPRRLCTAALALVAGAAVSVVATAPAAAGAVVAPHARFAPAVAGFNQNGHNWSGYAKHGAGFRTVSASWTEPHVRCSSKDNLFAPWVGIDGYGSKTVEQTGVATWCTGTAGHYKAHYKGWYEMYPKSPVYYRNTVLPGDRISAHVTHDGTHYTLRLDDLTRHWRHQVVRTLDANNASAEVIMESPTGSYPDFGAVHFHGALINGHKLGAVRPVALDASNKGGYEDHTSRIVRGGAFTITFRRA